MEELQRVLWYSVEDNYYLEKCQLVEVEDKDYKIDNFSAVYYQIGFSFQYQSTSTTDS